MERHRKKELLSIFFLHDPVQGEMSHSSAAVQLLSLAVGRGNESFCAATIKRL